MNNLVRITTDNEWIGKYNLLEQQFENDGIPLVALGDNLPTGTKEQVGGKSFFKMKLREIDQTPSSDSDELYAQMCSIYREFPEEFLENYGACPRIIEDETDFLQESKLPLIPALAGNREYDYQLLLNLLANETGVERVDYMEELRSCEKFDLYKKPKTEMMEATSILWLPYSPDAKDFDVEKGLDELRDMDARRITIMTHENPCAELFGSERKAKMQETLDAYIKGAIKINDQVKLFCGHLDISSEFAHYKGAIVQPISMTESIILDTVHGHYKKEIVR